MVLNALIDIYVNCVRIHKTWELFNKIHDANIDSCYAMIIGYTQNRFYEEDPRDFYSRSTIIA